MAVMSDVGPGLIGKYFTPSMRDNGHLVALKREREREDISNADHHLQY